MLIGGKMTLDTQPSAGSLRFIAHWQAVISILRQAVTMIGQSNHPSLPECGTVSFSVNLFSS